jgi:hypothetical protein
MTNDLFADPAELGPPQIDESKNYLNDLVGQDKKFKDVEALAKGKWYADAQIEVQNKKMDQLRNDYLQLKADYEARAKLEEYLDQIQNKPQSTLINEDTHTVKESNAPAIKPEDIDSMINKRIAESKTADRAQQNLDVVMEKLREQYATNWQTVLKERTEELGLTAEEVNAMARRSPKLFFKTMDMDQPRQQQQQFQAPPRSDTRFAPQGAPKKTWTYYQDQYKKNPKLYYDPKMTQEMVESHAALGTEFEDGDFRVYGDTLGRL